MKKVNPKDVAVKKVEALLIAHSVPIEKIEWIVVERIAVDYYLGDGIENEFRIRVRIGDEYIQSVGISIKKALSEFEQLLLNRARKATLEEVEIDEGTEVVGTIDDVSEHF